MPSNTFLTHCKVCGDPITDSTQRVTCVKHRKRMTNREIATCPCGQPAENIRSKYCGETCRKKWGIKPPAKTSSHVCQNSRCGETFERPLWYPGKRMFCSLKCSNEEHSRYRGQHYKFGDVHMASGYELRFVGSLLRVGVINWSPWPDDRPFVYDGHEYRPDFLVEGMAIEIKGWDEMNNQAEIRKHWNFPEPLVLVDRERLNRLEKMFNRQQFLDALSFMS